LKYRLKYFDNYKGLSTKDIYRIINDCDTVDTLVTLENATNGNVFNSIIDVDNDCVEVEGKDGKMTFTVTQKWWNAPYKGGKE
jgi:hypothetical protein